MCVARADNGRLARDLADVAFLDRFGIDVRDTAHYLLWGAVLGAGLPEQDYHAMMEPYLNGYWKKTDGMSSPVFSHDMCRPIFYRHDYDYYRGLHRGTADLDMANRMRYFPFSTLQRFLIYRTVRLVAWRAYRIHAKRRKTIPGYGTDAHIKSMQDWNG